jgi:hypothetical protein
MRLGDAVAISCGYGEFSRRTQPLGGSQHDRPNVTSGREAGTALGAACGQDATAGAGAHPKAKPVRFSPTPGVRLESALHERLLMYGKTAS